MKDNPLKINAERYYKKLNAEIAIRASFMNDTKWQKLIELLQNERINSLEIKFLLDDIVRKNFDFGYVNNNYCDTMIGAFYLKEIEWIFIPKQLEKQRFNRDEQLTSDFTVQNLDGFVEKLEKLGQFQYEKDENGVKIFAYK